MTEYTRPYIRWPQKPGVSEIRELEVDGVSLSKIKNLVSGPTFVTSLNAVRQRAVAYVEQLHVHFPKSKVFYAMKANAAPAVLQEVARAGCGVDIVSIGEFRSACASGIPATDICFAGVGKLQSEILEAIQSGLGIINVEHSQELSFILDLLQERRSSSESQAKLREREFKNNQAEPLLAIRLNPCVESQTHPHLKTGALDSKFGMLLEQIEDWLKTTRLRFTKGDSFDSARFTEFVAPVRGIHVHIGSQLQSHDVFPLVLQRVRECVLLLLRHGISIDHLDLGGGLGVGMTGVPLDASDIRAHIDFQANALKELVTSDSQLQNLWGSRCENVVVCLEPGRSIIASSTVFLTDVLYEKANLDSVRFAYVDAGMNAFPRPAIYGAEHSTACANRPNLNLVAYRVFGPVCESGDVLARDAHLPQLYVGDTVVFFEAGAYCRSMASHYNLRPIPAEIFARDGEVTAIIPALDPTASRDIHAFSEILAHRRSVRQFRQDVALPPQVVRRAVDHALLAPNSSNLQMWEFYWVKSRENKQKLVKACLSQPAAATAQELIVCVARLDTWQANRQRMVDVLRRQEKVPASVLKYYEKLIPFAMNQGPLNLWGGVKALAVWLLGFFRPIPRAPTSRSDMRVWAVKSTALACENLILSLQAQGFDTCAMEGFDGVRVKKILGIPNRSTEIVMVIGTGVAKPEGIYGPRIRFDRSFYAFEI